MKIFRCKECGWICRGHTKGDIGKAHAHAEKHVGLWKLPAWLLPSANPEKLDEVLEELTVSVIRREDDFSKIRMVNYEDTKVKTVSDK